MLTTMCISDTRIPGQREGRRGRSNLTPAAERPLLHQLLQPAFQACRCLRAGLMLQVCKRNADVTRAAACTAHDDAHLVLAYEPLHHRLVVLARQLGKQVDRSLAGKNMNISHVLVDHSNRSTDATHRNIKESYLAASDTRSQRAQRGQRVQQHLPAPHVIGQRGHRGSAISVML